MSRLTSLCFAVGALTLALPAATGASPAGGMACSVKASGAPCVYVAPYEGIYRIEGQLPSTQLRPGTTLTVAGHECVTIPGKDPQAGMARLSCYAALMGGRAYELSGKGIQGTPVAFNVVASIPSGGETVTNIP